MRVLTLLAVLLAAVVALLVVFLLTSTILEFSTVLNRRPIG